LAKTAFGYFVGVTILLGGLLSFAFTEVYAGSATVGSVAFAVAVVGGCAVIAATAWRRPWAPHLALGVLVLGSLAVAILVLGAPLAAPGYALDPHTHVPVGGAFPGYARVLTAPFNIA